MTLQEELNKIALANGVYYFGVSDLSNKREFIVEQGGDEFASVCARLPTWSLYEKCCNLLILDRQHAKPEQIFVQYTNNFSTALLIFRISSYSSFFHLRNAKAVCFANVTRHVK